MKKALALLLCALLTITGFAACNNNSTVSSEPSGSQAISDTTSASDDESSEAPVDPAAYYFDRLYKGDKYVGKTFTVLTSGVNPTAVSELVYNEDLSANENFPTVINDTIQERNRKVEALLGVEIKEQYFHDRSRHGGITLAEIRNAIQGSANAFQAISVCLYDCGTLAMENSLYDLNSIETLDLTNPWWDAPFSESVGIGGKQYFMLGDMSINYKSAVPCIYYNQSLIKSLGLTDPYELARTGKWTVDAAYELASGYNENIDGVDGIQYTDCYGWAGQYDDMYAMLYGAGVRIVSPDSNGYPYLSLYSETANTAVEKILTLMLDKEHYISGNDLFGKTDTPWPMEALQKAFIEGRVMFYGGGIDVAINLSAMEDIFGILPIPKLNEEQEEYYSMLNTWTTNAFAIAYNASADDAEMAGAVFDAMGYYSWGQIAGSLAAVYYEKVIKDQKLTLAESSEMLDLIFAQRGCEMGSVFQIGKISGSKPVNDMLGDIIKSGQAGGFSAAYDSYSAVFQADVDAVVEYFKQN